MIIEKNNYFEEKAITFDVMRRYFKSHPLDEANIARMFDNEVIGAEDSEQLIIAEIVFDYVLWKISGVLPASDIERIKRLTNEIIQSNQTFTHLNADEYKDFIAIVKELNESKIEILVDNR